MPFGSSFATEPTFTFRMTGEAGAFAFAARVMLFGNVGDAAKGAESSMVAAPIRKIRDILDSSVLSILIL